LIAEIEPGSLCLLIGTHDYSSY